MKSATFIIGLLSIFLLAGCATDKPYVPAPAKEIKPIAPINTETTVNSEGFSIVDETNTCLRVRFSGTSAEKSFCEALVRRLAEAINKDGKVRVVNDTPYDLIIAVNPEFEIFDRDGDYVRIKCKQVFFSIRPMHSKSKDVYAVKTVVPADLPRQLGADRAKEQYLPPVATEAVPFLNKELERICDNMLAVTEMKFRLKNYLSKPSPVQLAAQVEKINTVLSNMPGIVSIQNISQDTASASCTYRIVYLKEQFPQGIANVINLKLVK